MVRFFSLCRSGLSPVVASVSLPRAVRLFRLAVGACGRPSFFLSDDWDGSGAVFLSVGVEFFSRRDPLLFRCALSLRIWKRGA